MIFSSVRSSGNTVCDMRMVGYILQNFTVQHYFINQSESKAQEYDAQSIHTATILILNRTYTRNISVIQKIIFKY